VAEERTQGSASYGTSRSVLVGSLIGLLLAALGLVILTDRQGGQKLLASIYDLLGNAAGAEALRNGQGDQFLAKVVLAGIALLVGVGGIWLAVFLSQLGKRPLLPMKDPEMLQAMAHGSH